MMKLCRGNCMHQFAKSACKIQDFFAPQKGERGLSFQSHFLSQKNPFFKSHPGSTICINGTQIVQIVHVHTHPTQWHFLCYWPEGELFTKDFSFQRYRGNSMKPPESDFSLTALLMQVSHFSTNSSPTHTQASFNLILCTRIQLASEWPSPPVHYKSLAEEQIKCRHRWVLLCCTNSQVERESPSCCLSSPSLFFPFSCSSVSNWVISAGPQASV